MPPLRWPHSRSAATRTRTAFVLLAWLLAGALAAVGPSARCPPHTGDRMVVAYPGSREQPQGGARRPYYTLQRCSNTANGGEGLTTEPIDAAKHAGAVAVLDVANCNLSCLGADAFDFPGARDVTHVRMGGNPFVSLPGPLLWNMTSLVDINVEASKNLITLPKEFFRGLGSLAKIVIKYSARLGTEQLPASLLRGLGSLAYLDLTACGSVDSLPNLDDLTALKTLLVYTDYGGAFSLNETDSATTFNRLGSLVFMSLIGNLLVSVPSLEGLTRLTSLWLTSNKITRIDKGAFAGAPLLMSINVANNR